MLGPLAVRYFDGMTPERHQASLTVTEERLSMVVAGREIAWALDHATAARLADDTLQVAPDPSSDEVIELDPGLPADRVERAVRRAAPRAMGLIMVIKATGLFTGAAAAIAGLVFWLAPALAERMAHLVPVDAEIALGEQVADTLGGIIGVGYCEDPAALSAIEAIADRLNATELAHVPLTFRLLKSGMPNAFAVPGGTIVLTTALVRMSDSPEAVAAVIGHEIGHVVARDPVRQTLRAAGSAGIISLVIGDFTGGAIAAAVIDHVINASYSRDAERSADAFSIALMERARIDIEPFVSFFETLNRLNGDTPAWIEPISTHPETAERIETVRRAADAQSGDLMPVIDAQAWRALETACPHEPRRALPAELEE